MSDTTDLTPQEPGANPAVQTTALEALLAGEVGDLVDALPNLTDADLETLGVLEQQGAARSLVLDSIGRERDRRDAEAVTPTPVVVAPTPNIDGDAVSYAHMHAHEIDSTKLRGRVLTKDGWLLPHPSAVPQG